MVTNFTIAHVTLYEFAVWQHEDERSKLHTRMGRRGFVLQN